jgi:hypothetical protein
MVAKTPRHLVQNLDLAFGQAGQLLRLARMWFRSREIDL